MIGKIIIGSDFGGLCRYALDEKKWAEVVAASGVRNWSAEVMEEDFNDQRLLRPGLGRAVMHVALSWPPEETQKLSNEAMVKQTLEYLDGMKIDPLTTQWALIRHYDQEHPHAHLILNRVTNAGGVISDANNFAKSAEACRTVEEENGLINAGELGEQRHRKLVERHALGEREAVKLKVKDALEKHLPHATSVQELTTLLAGENIEMRLTSRKDRLQVLFVHADHPEMPVKGSEVDREYGGNNLYKTLEDHRNWTADAVAEYQAEEEQRQVGQAQLAAKGLLQSQAGPAVETMAEETSFLRQAGYQSVPDKDIEQNEQDDEIGY